jgi:hypothetical protein
MLLRVRDFGANHQDRFPESSPGGQMFATLAGIVAEIDRHATNKLVTVREARRLRTDRRKLMLERMRAIARTSRGIRTESGSRLRLEMPDRSSDIAIVRAARAFLQEAEPYQDQLVPLGLPASSFAELRTAANAFEAAMTERRTGRSGVAGAQAGIKAALARGAETARTLDIIVANTLGSDPVAMASWNRDLRLVDGRSKSVAGSRQQPTPGVPAAAAPPAVTTTDDPLRRAS